MVGESNKNIFFIQKESLNFAELEISEFEISRFDCIYLQFFQVGQSCKDAAIDACQLVAGQVPETYKT